jgi:hypothetical protein
MNPNLVKGINDTSFRIQPQAGNTPWTGIGSKPTGSFFGNLKNSANSASYAPKKAPHDAPIPAGIANFKANDPSTWGGNASTKTTNTATTPGSPSAAAAQQQSDLTKYFPGLANKQANPEATPPSANPPSTGIAGAFSNIINNQANTTPLASVGNAVNSAQNVATAQPSQNLNNIYGGAQTSADISQNQTPAVTQAEQQYNEFAQSNPYMTAAQSNPNVAADVASGRTSQLGQTFATELAAKQGAVSNALSGQGQQISAAGQQGNLGLSGQSNQLSGAATAGGLANTAQSNQIGAQQNAAGNILNSLAQNGYVTMNKLTGTAVNPAGAQSAAVTGNIIDQNANSASSLQGDISTINSDKAGIDANFQYVNNLAQQAKLSDSPILAQLQIKAANNLISNSAVAGYKQTLSSIAQQATKYGVDLPADPTPSQLQGAQKAIAANIQNLAAGKQKTLDQLKTGASPSATSGGYTGATIQTAAGTLPIDY